MRRRLALVLLLALMTVPAAASEWGTIEPGTSTMDSVRTQYGGPTRTTTQKVDKYDTVTWTYENAQAPRGLHRMVVEFGLLQSGAFRRELVRSLRLEPKPYVFHRRIVLAGWGPPDRAGKQGGVDVFFYAQGLIVTFDKNGQHAESLVFTPPQPLEPDKPSR
jgi:hypothetical protein